MSETDLDDLACEHCNKVSCDGSCLDLRSWWDITEPNGDK